MKFTVNSTIGCTQFPKTGIQEGRTAAGVLFIANTTTLTPLTVLVGNDQIKAGATVYVSSKDYTMPWAKNIFKTEDMEVIFVPVSQVLMVSDRFAE